MTKPLQEITGTLITIGDEILLGDISNGNARHIAFELRNKGFRLDQILTIGDREEEIIETLARALASSSFLIVTGGLGPTEDDRTCAAVSRAFGRPIVSDPGYCRWLEEHLAEFGIHWNDETRKLAELPDGAVKLGRETAGFSLLESGKPCYFLPGVPHEMEDLLAREVLPDLGARFPLRPVYVKHTLRFHGQYEAQISERLRGLSFSDLGIEIGYYPQVVENWVALFVIAPDLETAQRNIAIAEWAVLDRIGAHYLIGRNEETLEETVGKRLRELDLRVATAESCTGGLLARRLTEIAGSSDYFDRGCVTYSNVSKTEFLGIPAELIREQGAVSEPVALAMAQGIRRFAGVHVGVGITGIAGPAGGSPEKPVGTVFIACATRDSKVVERHLFYGDRTQIRENAAQAALVLLWRTIGNDSDLHRAGTLD